MVRHWLFKVKIDKDDFSNRGKSQHNRLRLRVKSLDNIQCYRCNILGKIVWRKINRKKRTIIALS